MSPCKDAKDDTVTKAFLSQSAGNFILEHQKRKEASAVISVSNVRVFGYVSTVAPPNILFISTLSAVSTASGFADCLQYFQFPLKCLAWQLLQPFPLQLRGLWGSSNGAFEEITLYSSSSREKKTKDVLARSLNSQSHRSCLTHLVAKISSYLI